MKNGMPDPEISIELGPIEEILDDPNWGIRTFSGTLGKLPLRGSIQFVPRGSSGYEDTPLAAIVLSHPPALAGEFESVPEEYDGQQYVDGLPIWRAYDDKAVLASIEKAIPQCIDSLIGFLSEG